MVKLLEDYTGIGGKRVTRFDDDTPIILDTFCNRIIFNLHEYNETEGVVDTDETSGIKQLLCTSYILLDELNSKNKNEQVLEILEHLDCVIELLKNKSVIS